MAADGGLALRLPYLAIPLDWETTAAYLAAHAIPGVESVANDTCRRTVVVGSDVGVLELCPGGRDQLVLRAHLPHWEELVHVVRRARRIASLDFDVSEPARHLLTDRVIGPLLRARPGLRPPGTWDPFETGVHAIAGQDATRHTANSITGRLVERLGRPVSGLRQFGLTHAFPAARTLADADLGGLGLSAAGAGAVRSFAHAVGDRSLRLDRSLGLDRLVSPLRAIDGVSHDTAHYLALRLGEPDAFPATDRDPPPAVVPSRAGFAAKPVGHSAEHWRPWRATGRHPPVGRRRQGQTRPLAAGGWGAGATA
ncbi:MAG TPA: AlkA N-terminal domain-containing protein [Streptosporangiaceae bacterium]